MNPKYELISTWLFENNIKTYKDYKISSKSWLKAGGIVKNFITKEEEDALLKIMDNILEIRDLANFDYSQISLSNPTMLTGNNYYTKIVYIKKTLIIKISVF